MKEQYENTKICEKRYYKSNLNFNFTTRIIDYFIFVRIQSISGYVVQINYPNNIAIKDEFENVYWIKPFGDFEDKYEIGDEVKVYYYPNSEDGSNENTLSHSIVFSR